MRSACKGARERKTPACHPRADSPMQQQAGFDTLPNAPGGSLNATLATLVPLYTTALGRDGLLHLAADAPGGSLEVNPSNPGTAARQP